MVKNSNEHDSHLIHNIITPLVKLILVFSPCDGNDGDVISLFAINGSCCCCVFPSISCNLVSNKSIFADIFSTSSVSCSTLPVNCGEEFVATGWLNHIHHLTMLSSYIVLLESDCGWGSDHMIED